MCDVDGFAYGVLPVKVFVIFFIQNFHEFLEQYQNDSDWTNLAQKLWPYPNYKADIVHFIILDVQKVNEGEVNGIRDPKCIRKEISLDNLFLAEASDYALDHHNHCVHLHYLQRDHEKLKITLIQIFPLTFI